MNRTELEEAVLIAKEQNHWSVNAMLTKKF